MQGREAIREAIALGLGISFFVAAECPPDPRIRYLSLDTGGRKYQMNSYLVIQRERRNAAMMRALLPIATAMAGDRNRDGD